MNQNDMVYYKQDGNITAGGFKINSAFLSSGAPFATLYKQMGGSSGGSSLLDGLAVPAGLLMIQQSIGGGDTTPRYKTSEKNVINDTLYDKLLKLASNGVEEPKNTSKKTKKNFKKSKTHRKTKKHK
jgi:hypothetical protein